jgi:hypothetical protein
MKYDLYGMVVIVLEFVISLVVLLGGGFLLYTGHSPEVAISAITAVITFWFARRSAEAQARAAIQPTPAIEVTAVQPQAPAVQQGTAPQVAQDQSLTKFGG